MRGRRRFFRRARAKVKLVALTNGDVGHFAQAGGPLAQRRKAEVEACHEKLGVATDVLDIHDGELMPDLETRKKVANLIRDWQADIVLSHRPWDYHPDHRAVGKLAEDAAVVVAAPYFAPYTPPTKGNPIFLFYSDNFKKPYPFDPIIAVGFDEVAQKKWDCISASAVAVRRRRFVAGALRPERSDRRGRAQGVPARRGETAQRGRGEPVPRPAGEALWRAEGPAIKYAEAFELNQYGRAATADELKAMFPDIPVTRTVARRPRSAVKWRCTGSAISTFYDAGVSDLRSSWVSRCFLKTPRMYSAASCAFLSAKPISAGSPFTFGSGWHSS